MNQYIYVRPRDDGQGWAVDVYDGRRAWAKTHLGERPLNKAEAHRVAHKLRAILALVNAADAPPWLADAAEALGEVRPEDGAPLALNWTQVIDAIHDLRDDRDHWKTRAEAAEPRKVGE